VSQGYERFFLILLPHKLAAGCISVCRKVTNRTSKTF